jgi:hypothetical protein
MDQVQAVSNSSVNTHPPHGKRWTAMVAALVLFLPPIGAAVAWRTTTWPKPVKVLLALWGALSVVTCIQMANNPLSPTRGLYFYAAALGAASRALLRPL